MKIVSFKPDGLRFPNPNSIQKLKVSFVKGKNEMKNFNHRFENTCVNQSKKFSQTQVKGAYWNYLCESMNGITSSQESLLKTSK